MLRRNISIVLITVLALALCSLAVSAPAAEREASAFQPDWYLAEGSTDWGFDTWIALLNPNDQEVTCEITYMTKSGPVSGSDVVMPANSRATIHPKDEIGATDFSTHVHCVQGWTVAADRTMAWGAYGHHASIGVTGADTDWYMPEGSSKWGFECWIPIQNPNDQVANVDLTYMIEGENPVTVPHQVPANTRSTFNMEIDIGQKDASILVESDVAVIPERTMYRNSRREGHDSIGTTTPAPSYYLAEGTTAWGFTTYLTIQNPHATATDVTVTYMTPSGPVPHPENPVPMPPNSRETIRVNDFLTSRDFSTQVTGTQTIIAERSMYWDNGTGEAMHDSIGMEAPLPAVFLPDGRAASGVETWTVVQNPNGVPVDVRIVYFREDFPDQPLWEDFTMNANSRESFNMADSGINGNAGVVVICITEGYEIMAERAMYWDNRSGGTDTIGGLGDIND
jgi:hypothetical protein